MVYFALDTFSGLETRDAYRKGMQYNRNIEKARAQEALGWSLSFDFPTRAATGNARAGTLDVTLRDRDAQPVTGARLRVGFSRPTSDGLDVKLPWVERGAGLYRVDVALSCPGQWDPRISRNAAGIVFGSSPHSRARAGLEVTACPVASIAVRSRRLRRCFAVGLRRLSHRLRQLERYYERREIAADVRPLKPDEDDRPIDFARHVRLNTDGGKAELNLMVDGIHCAPAFGLSIGFVETTGHKRPGQYDDPAATVSWDPERLTPMGFCGQIR